MHLAREPEVPYEGKLSAPLSRAQEVRTVRYLHEFWRKEYVWDFPSIEDKRVKENAKQCGRCMFYEIKIGGATCTNATVNAKWPPFLAEGEFITCITERGDIARPCGTQGKLFVAADAETMKSRTSNYFRPPR
jgi:hypothetical protein